MANSQVTFFNRHESIDSYMMDKIRGAIKELFMLDVKTSTIENYLYGVYDGYDYSEIALDSKELLDIAFVSPQLGIQITEIFATIKNYPRTSEPNNNSF
jgi:hypothetical protein